VCWCQHSIRQHQLWQQSQTQRHQQDDDNEESLLISLVHFIRKLADCKQQLFNGRDEDQNHEQQIN
jgi:hypothetical protein